MLGGLATARAGDDALGTLLGLAGVRDLVRAIPLSVLLAPETAQARLPALVSWP